MKERYVNVYRREEKGRSRKKRERKGIKFESQLEGRKEGGRRRKEEEEGGRKRKKKKKKERRK